MLSEIIGGESRENSRVRGGESRENDPLKGVHTLEIWYQSEFLLKH